MTTLVEQFIQEADRAGYIETPEEIHMAIKLEDRWVILVAPFTNDVPDYLVGIFWRETTTKSADWSPNPEIEGTLDECIDWIRQNV